MRLWHQDLIAKLPRQQLLGQHRECCALRGKGWQRKHATVNYVFDYSPYRLFKYHELIMQEMTERGYRVSPEWLDKEYRGKQMPAYDKLEAETLPVIIYPEHDQVDYATITNPSDSDIWDALVQLPVSYDSLYLTYSEKGAMSFIFVEYEDDKYRLEHDTPELGLELTNVARVSQQVARDILIRFSKEHSVILDDHWKQEKVR